MSQKIILPGQEEIAGLRLDSSQQTRYWNEPITRGEAQKAMGQIVNEALQGFLGFLGANFELVAKTPLGEQLLQEMTADEPVEEQEA